MKKFVKFIFKLLLILIIAFVGIFFGKGYWGYLELTQSQSVDDVVSESHLDLLLSDMMIYHLNSYGQQWQ